MEEDLNGSARRVSSRTRKVASKMVAALTSADNRNQAALARLDALENDNAAAEAFEDNDDDEASLDEDDQVYIQKRQSSNMKRKTRQGKARENAKKAPKTFHELLQEANLESLPPHVPSYLRAAYVDSLLIIHVSDVGYDFALSGARIYTMTLVVSIHFRLSIEQVCLTALSTEADHLVEALWSHFLHYRSLLKRPLPDPKRYEHPSGSALAKFLFG
ncbi:hypothetical protein V2J09_018143 [Rumex salicifolius]